MARIELPEYWIVGGHHILDENYGEWGGVPQQCINCGEWFTMEGDPICCICHRKMLVCILIFEQILGLPSWYPELVILPDFAHYTFNEAVMKQYRQKRGA